jgi:uncharacterized protein
VLQPVLPPIVIFPDQAWLAEHVKAAETVYATGGFREVLAFRIEEVAAFLPLHIYVFPRTLGLFLLGALSWRAGFFDWGRRFPDWLWVTSALFIGVGLWLTVKAAAIPIMPPAGTVSMTLGYATLVLAVETSETGRRWLRWAEPVGRMAFTNYIAQSVVLGFVFYGYGLGLFGELGPAAGLVLTFGIYGAQILVSRLWLTRFRYGPIEWLWRALMYGRAPQLRMPRSVHSIGDDSTTVQNS